MRRPPGRQPASGGAGVPAAPFSVPSPSPALPDLHTRLQVGLADHYRVEREVGAGGMARVYLARDLKHDRSVAVKVLRPELAGLLGPERFLREIATTANLHHPHILTLFDSGQVQDPAGVLLYYVMPYVEGESLRDRITREKRLAIEDALQIAREVADALAYAHSRQLVHRDIKPENILLENGHAIVTDFGIARAIASAVTRGEALTETGLAVGTTAYMSPEQAAADRRLDGRSDLYALGVVLFEMLAGQPPFTGPTAGVVLRQVLTAAAPPLTQFRPAVPPRVVDTVARALAKDPADRPGSAREFAQALDAPGRPRRPAIFAARPVRWGLSLAGIAALLLAAWLFLRSDATGTAAGAAPRSIAVLPFRNLSGNPAEDYFSDGVTEEILHALTQIPDLRVAARTSAFQFKGRAVDLREVGERLGVAAVLEGSIQRDGESVRITTQLTDTRTGYQIWSGKFDRHLADLFAIEDEISRALADTLKVSLGLVPRPAGSPPSVEAHDLHLRAMSLLSRRGTALNQAIADFQGAIARDSAFAPAWAGLAAAYELLPAYYLATYAEALPKAEQAARRAIALDSTLGPAYTVLGSVYRDRFQWAAADSALRRALRLAPNDAEAAEQYGQLLFWSGQPEAALKWMGHARALDPLAPIPALTTGVALLFLHRYDSASAILRRAASLGPDLAISFMWRTWTELNAGRYDSAGVAARRMAELSGVDPHLYEVLIRGVADPRHRDEARGLLAQTPGTLSWALGADYRPTWLMLLGDTAGALDAVDRIKRAPSLNAVLGLWNPALDPIRDHPRFRSTLTQLGLPFRGGLDL